MRILVDMDGVLADFERGFLRDWQTQYPERPFIPVEERTIFYVQDEYPQEQRGQVYDIMTEPGFFRTLPPFPGGADALNAMRAAGHSVHICTTPLVDYEHCVLEKYEWVETHLGRDWTTRIILARDKTMIQGDILIDDRPDLHGELTPTWEHVIYDQPYNRATTGKRRLTWANWRSVLLADDTERRAAD